MKLFKFGALAVSSMLAASAAQAQTTYSLQLPILGMANEAGTSKTEGADEAKTKTGTVTTADHDNAYLAINIDKMSVYVFPLADLRLIALSYWVDTMEFGVSLGINSSKVDKPKNELASNAFGVFAGYALPITPEKLNAEFYLYVDSGSEKGTEETAAGDVKTNKTSSSVKLTADIICNINKQVAYVGGINYTTASGEDKEAKTKTTSGTFGVNLATLRLSF